MDEFKNNRNVQSPPRHGEEGRNRTSRDEEYAAEMTTGNHRAGSSKETVSIYGWIGLALSILSYFMWPIMLAAAGIILGFISRNKGADTLGNVAIAAGAISILITIFILPFF